MKKAIIHIKRWDKWRKRSLNSPFYKLLVLLGVIHSPTFEFVLDDRELENAIYALHKALGGEPGDQGNA